MVEAFLRHIFSQSLKHCHGLGLGRKQRLGTLRDITTDGGGARCRRRSANPIQPWASRGTRVPTLPQPSFGQAAEWRKELTPPIVSLGDYSVAVPCGYF